jgi:hypothetical protein
VSGTARTGPLRTESSVHSDPAGDAISWAVPPAASSTMGRLRSSGDRRDRGAGLAHCRRPSRSAHRRPPTAISAGDGVRLEERPPAGGSGHGSPWLSPTFEDTAPRARYSPERSADLTGGVAAAYGGCVRRAPSRRPGDRLTGFDGRAALDRDREERRLLLAVRVAATRGTGPRFPDWHAVADRVSLGLRSGRPQRAGPKRCRGDRVLRGRGQGVERR